MPRKLGAGLVYQNREARDARVRPPPRSRPSRPNARCTLTLHARLAGGAWTRRGVIERFSVWRGASVSALLQPPYDVRATLEFNFYFVLTSHARARPPRRPRGSHDGLRLRREGVAGLDEGVVGHHGASALIYLVGLIAPILVDELVVN